MKPQSFEIFTDLLDARIQAHPEKHAYTYLDGKTTEDINYGQLGREIYRYASVLQEHDLYNERVILIYPVGLEFMFAFYGCMFSGAVAIPASEPRKHKLDKSDLNRLMSIIEDSRPKAILTTSGVRDAMKSQLQEQLPDLSLLWLTEETFAAGDPAQYRKPLVKPDHLTFLQYTSGSTGSPKGVMISHQNLMANEAMIAECFGNNPETVIVSWLPLFHDMGLICNMLQASYLGVPAIHMPPSAFVRQPILWLQTLTKYRGTFSGGPNFAYDLCVQRIKEERKAQLDLSHWQAALNGSEPVRQQTLDRFAKAFASCGFDPKAMNPCYGLAEATVYASGYLKSTGYGLENLESKAFSENRALSTNNLDDSISIVGCGHAVMDGKIRIVDPITRQLCDANGIGEIWVKGDHIGQGYWEKEEISENTFRARLADSDDQDPYLRTGDFGFMRGDELYFTGRMKELIIIHGHNYYPQDIERTVEAAHPALRAHCGAAFSVEVHGEEKLVVVFEVLRKFRHIDFEEVFEAIRKEIAAAHDLPTHAIVLIQPKTMPKTTSGKLQRRGCRAQFLDGSLSILAEWRAPAAKLQQATPVATLAAQGDLAGLTHLIRTTIAELTQLPIDVIEPTTPFLDLGLDSVGATALIGSLSDHLQTELSPTLVYDFPNLKKLASHLAGEPETTQPEPISVANPTPVSEGNEPIAVVGLGCRFPGAPNPSAFWDMLLQQTNGVGEIPHNRPDLESLRGSGRSSTQKGGFLDEVDQFDPSFFGISPLEAEAMDPQQRLLLEVAWEALATAGCQPEKLSGSATGVYLGIANVDYARLPNEAQSEHGAYYGTGTAASIAANRLSYMLNLQGPSMAIDTACSSSLVALHQACTALRQRECDLALTGGVNLILTPDLTLTFDKAGMMSATGACKTFDAGADGYVRGEGCGMVILKRLADAQANNDRILAVVRGSAINQDGRSNGLTAPNGTVQQKVIRAALSRAGVAPADVGFVETHGTGTPLGDPIEFGALQAVLSHDRSDQSPCLLGSVKTNLGHLEAAAGIAGFIKVVMALKHQTIPPNLHFETSNPNINLDKAPFDIPKTPQPWQAINGQKRLAGLSSFGFGGTNAHVILEEAPEPKTSSRLEEKPSHHLIHFSAPRAADLKVQAKTLVDYLKTHQEANAADVAHSVNIGRQDFEHRLVVSAASAHEMAQAFEAFANGKQGLWEARQHTSTDVSPVFLFSGQGSQYREMGKELYRSQPVFRQTMDHCSDLLEPHLGYALVSKLYENPVDDQALSQTALAQPALFALEYALYKLWESWGVQPSAVIGHSLGELVAAVIAGVFSLEDGLRLVAARGHIMQAQPSGGAMASVFTDEETLLPLMATFPNLAIAAFNGPKQCVLSGPEACMTSILARLDEKGIRHQRLPVSHAYHSVLMEPALEPFRAVAETVTYHPPKLPLIGNLLGTQASSEIAHADYWVRHIRQPVQFARGIRHLLDAGKRTFVEVGPGTSLLSISRRCFSKMEVEESQFLPSLRQNRSAWDTMLETLGQLYLHGTSVLWSGLDQTNARKLLPLPAYAWQKQRYWLPTTHKMTVSHPQTLPSTFQHELTWEPKPVIRKDAPPKAHGSWLIFSDTRGLGMNLAAQLRSRGETCFVALPGEEFRQVDAHAFQLNPANPADIAQCLDHVAGSLQTPLRGVLHLWSLDATNTTQTNLAELEVAQILGVGSALELVKLLPGQKEMQDVPLWFVTKGAQALAGETTNAIAQAPLWGWARSLPLEYPNIHRRLVDLDPEASLDASAQILIEALDHGDREDQVVYRHHDRYAARLQTKQLDQATPFTWRKDGSYLITGGLGNLGMQIAAHLVKQGVGQIAFTGRSAPSKAVSQKLEAFERQGIEILVVQADIADEKAVTHLAETLESQKVPLRGVIHAAGTSDLKTMESMTRDDLWAVFHAKMRGTWLLFQAFKDQNLDFFFMLSSVSSVWGAKGLSHYAAANHFLDAFAHYGQSVGLRTIAANLGPVDGGGMATSDKATRQTMENMGLRFLHPEDVTRGIDQLLRSDASQSLIADVDWATFGRIYAASHDSPLFENLSPQTVMTNEDDLFLETLKTSAIPQHMDLMVDHVAHHVARIMKLRNEDLPDPNKGFFDLGMDSLMVLELKARLQHSLNLEIDTTAAFEYTTVNTLAAFLLETLFPKDTKQQSSAVKPAEKEATPALAEAISQLSEAELSALIDEELGSLTL